MKHWLDANMLSLNICKINCIIFHCSADSIQLCTAIKIIKNNIAKVKYIEFMGILLASILLGDIILLNFQRSCAILFKVRHLLPRRILNMLYNLVFLFCAVRYYYLGSKVCSILRTNI